MITEFVNTYCYNKIQIGTSSKEYRTKQSRQWKQLFYKYA